LLTFTMNLLIDFVPTYSEKTNNDSKVNPISESDQKQLLANDEGSEKVEPILRKNSLNTDRTSE
jgi:hypothetical protein